MLEMRRNLATLFSSAVIVGALCIGMWSLRNETPFAALPSFVRDGEGKEIWLVAVKASFAIGNDGKLTVAQDQPPPCLEPVHHGAPGESSLQFDGDLVDTKAGTDIVLDGRAHTPNGDPGPSIDVYMHVGPVRKALRVFGDRSWRRTATGLEPSKPEPFTSLPIIYERAFGGPDLAADATAKAGARDPRNWVGVGFSSRADALVGQPVPNVELPSEPITSWRQRPAPAGFGAIERHWEPRASLGGTHDAQWVETRMPLPPIDADSRYLNCAPADQQVDGFLRGGEPVELVGVSPDGPLVFTLPRLDLGFRTLFEHHGESHEARLSTVVLQPEQRLCSLVWLSRLPCQGAEHLIDKTIIFEKRRLGRV